MHAQVSGIPEEDNTMARKLNITQEMEDALRKAKLPEEKIAELREMEVDSDVEKLDLDGLDGVSGGASLSDTDEGSFHDMAMIISDSLGLDVAVDVMASIYNLDVSFMREYARKSNGNAAQYWYDITLFYFHGKTIYV